MLRAQWGTRTGRLIKMREVGKIITSLEHFGVHQRRQSALGVILQEVQGCLDNFGLEMGRHVKLANNREVK